MTLVEHLTTLPRLAPGSMERTRLLVRLAEARHKTCVLILGPAGCGKTTPVLRWRAQATPFPARSSSLIKPILNDHGVKGECRVGALAPVL